MEFTKNDSSSVFNKKSVYAESAKKPEQKEILNAYNSFLKAYPNNELPKKPIFRLCLEIWGWNNVWHVSIHDTKKEAKEYNTQAEAKNNEVYIY